eukprot:1179613-Prorocentrum_minimum.AAC.2
MGPKKKGHDALDSRLRLATKRKRVEQPIGESWSLNHEREEISDTEAADLSLEPVTEDAVDGDNTGDTTQRHSFLTAALFERWGNETSKEYRSHARSLVRVTALQIPGRESVVLQSFNLKANEDLRAQVLNNEISAKCLCEMSQSVRASKCRWFLPAPKYQTERARCSMRERNEGHALLMCQCQFVPHETFHGNGQALSVTQALATVQIKEERNAMERAGMRRALVTDSNATQSKASGVDVHECVGCSVKHTHGRGVLTGSCAYLPAQAIATNQYKCKVCSSQECTYVTLGGARDIGKSETWGSKNSTSAMKLFCQTCGHEWSVDM